MRELFFRSLKPSGQLWFLLFICLLSFSLFSMFGSMLLNNLYGFDLSEDVAQLQAFDQPYVVSANKVLLLVQHLGLFILPALIFNQLFSNKSSPGFLFWGEKLKPTRVLVVFGLMLLAFPVINFLLELNNHLQLPQFLGGVETDIKSMEEEAGTLTNYMVSANGAWQLLTNLLVMAVVPAIGEEFLFRGLVQKILARWTGNVHVAIWLSAICFSALHFQFYGFLPRMMLGALFGYLVIWMGSIWYAVIAHFINNASSVLVIYFVQLKQLPAESENFGAMLSQAPYFVMALAAGLWLCARSSIFPKFKTQYLTHPYFKIDIKNREPEEE